MCVASLSNGSFYHVDVDVDEIPKEQIRRKETSWREVIAFGLVIAAVLSLSLFFTFSGFGSESPAFRVTKVAVHGINLTSPGFDVTITVENPNDDCGSIHYLKHSAVTVSYDGLCLGTGVLPDFYQPITNVTVLQTALTPSDDFVDGVAETALRYDERRGKVPLEVNITASYHYKVAFVKSLEFTIEVRCGVVLNKFDEEAKIISTNCAEIW